MKLSDAQKRHLKGLAHHLKPVVMVGQHGLKETIFEELEVALDAHELIKVRIAAERDERKEIAEQILQRTQAVLVQSIGQMVVLFRRNRKKPKLALPAI
jgi:RNA-binding protein